MPKVSVEIPQHIIDDINRHIGPDKKFLNFSEAV
ncbi:MAG: CopG family transcriptional regulator, partial [Candidatus Hodarchaeales archaeon]